MPSPRPQTPTYTGSTVDYTAVWKKNLEVLISQLPELAKFLKIKNQSSKLQTAIATFNVWNQTYQKPYLSSIVPFATTLNISPKFISFDQWANDFYKTVQQTTGVYGLNNQIKIGYVAQDQLYAWVFKNILPWYQTPNSP